MLRECKGLVRAPEWRFTTQFEWYRGLCPSQVILGTGFYYAAAPSQSDKKERIPEGSKL